ncbi:MAG: DUF983 domain-containing protein [Pirellulales bacterium]
MNADGGKPNVQRGLWRLILLVARALRLRCPACGHGKIFRGWFTMHDACTHCGRPFQRGPGFFLGSIYFNYGVTALVVTVLYFACFFTEVLTDRQLLVVTLSFALLFPLWFFRYARALWIAFDELWDPTLTPPASTDTAQQDITKRL